MSPGTEMLERAAEAAYKEHLERHWAFANNGNGIDWDFLPNRWECQTEYQKETWRRAVMAALRVYRVSMPLTSRVVIDSDFVCELPADYQTITIFPVPTK